jgi:predicted DNA-binding transcriptional regulator YafY
MYSPTTRLLTVLELLQSQGSVTGPELAAKLEVDVRSVRRYITMLRDMGIPVDSEPGRYGAYSLRPGFRLPPLMFNQSEIVAVVLGLMTARHVGLAATPGVQSALAKIERVLPDELRQRVRALQGVLTFDMPAYKTTSDEIIARFSLAAHLRQQLWLEYQAYGQEVTRRTVDVYGVVYHAGYWYATGFCHLRQGMRIFRLDRVRDVRLLDTEFEPVADFDPLQHLLDSIATLPGTWAIVALLKITMKQARDLVPRDVALLEEATDGVLMRCYTDSLAWMARFLVRLDCPLRVIQPPELRDELRRLAQSIFHMAEIEP